MKIFQALKMLLGLSPNCEKVNQFLSEYVEGTLPEETRVHFDEHIEMCTHCKPYIDQYQQTIDLCGDCDDVEIPEELIEHTMAFLRSNAEFPRS